MPFAQDEGDAGGATERHEESRCNGQFEIQGCVQNCTDSKSGKNHNIAMLSGELIETQALKVPCPTCRVGRGVRCERAIGGVRRQSHLERRLIASDKVKRKLKPAKPL